MRLCDADVPAHFNMHTVKHMITAMNTMLQSANEVIDLSCVCLVMISLVLHNEGFMGANADASAGIHFVTTETDASKLPKVLLKVLARPGCSSCIVNWSWMEDCLDAMILLDTAPYSLDRCTAPMMPDASTSTTGTLHDRVLTKISGVHALGNSQASLVACGAADALAAAGSVRTIPRFPVFSSGPIPVTMAD